MTKSIQCTFQTRLRLTPEEQAKIEALLDGYSKALRLAFALVFRKSMDYPAAGDLVRARYGLTARQWDAITFELRRIRSGWRDRLGAELVEAGRRLAFHQVKLHNSIQALTDWRKRYATATKDKGNKAAKIRAIKGHVFEHRSCVQRYQAQVDRLKAELVRDVPKVCFGTAELARQRWDAGKSGAAHKDIDAWRSDWAATRSSSMKLIGSKREPFGNLSIQYDPKAQTLAVTLLEHQVQEQINAITAKLGRVPTRIPGRRNARRVFLSGVRFSPEGAVAIEQALSDAKPLAMTLCRKVKKSGERAYYLMASFSVDVAETGTSPSKQGAIGVGFDGKACSFAYVDRSGNIRRDPAPRRGVAKSQGLSGLIKPEIARMSGFHVGSKGRLVADLEWRLAKASETQRMEMFKQVASEVVQLAKKANMDVALPPDSFLTFKSERHPARRANWMTAEDYSCFGQAINRAAQRASVRVIHCNQPFARVAGICKYSGSNNLSATAAEAFVVARWAMFEDESRKASEKEREKFVERVILSRPMPARVRCIPSGPRGLAWEGLAQVIHSDELRLRRKSRPAKSG